MWATFGNSQTEYGRGDSVGFLRLYKRHCSFLLALSHITHSRRSQLPCYKDTQASLQRCPTVKHYGLPPATSRELRPSAKSRMHKPSWNQIFQPQSSLQMIIALANTLITTSRETLDQDHLVKPLPNSWPRKLQEIINIHCFKLLKVGVICYTAIDY